MATKKTTNHKNKHKARKFFKIAGYVVLGYLCLSLLLTIIYRFANPPITILMVQRCIEQKFSSDRKVRLQKEWVSLDEISPNMVRAVVASEDNNFVHHHGFDFQSIKRAQRYNEKTGKKARGASTISQQTAKNVFLWIQKSYIRKGLEVWQTSLIELIWGKARIMEVYLNVIEFGDGIYGVEAASEYYFNKHAEDLTKREAALLAACLPSPLTRNPASPSSYLSNRASMIQ